MYIWIPSIKKDPFYIVLTVWWCRCIANKHIKVNQFVSLWSSSINREYPCIQAEQTMQRGFAPVVFNNQIVLERDTSMILRKHCGSISYWWESHISKSWTNKSTPVKMAVNLKCGYSLYFVSSRERPWRHRARSMIHATRRMLYASIPVFLFERVRRHTSCARDDKRLPLECTLTSRSFSRWDKVYVWMVCHHTKQMQI